MNSVGNTKPLSLPGAFPVATRSFVSVVARGASVVTAGTALIVSPPAAGTCT